MSDRVFRSIDKLNFGMYKGHQLGLVYIFDPQYIEWCVNNVEGFTIKDFDFLQTVKVLNPELNWEHRMIKDPTATINGFGVFDSFDDAWIDLYSNAKGKYKFSENSLRIIRENQEIYGIERRMYNPYEGEYYYQ